MKEFTQVALKIKSILRNTFHSFFYMIVLGCLLLLTSVSLEAKVFRIIGTPSEPFKISSNPDDDKPGIAIEILKLIMEEMGVKYEIQLIASSPRVKHEAEQGNCEMLINFSMKKERLQFLMYPQESYRFINWNFFIRKDDEGKITYDSLEDFKGLKIGAVREESYTKEFWEAEEYLDFDIVSLKEVQIRKLINNRIDVVPLSTESTLYKLNHDGNSDLVTYLPKPLKSKPYYDPIVKASDYFNPPPESTKTKEEIMQEFIDRYDELIRKFTQNGTIDKIYTKYRYHNIIQKH